MPGDTVVTVPVADPIVATVVLALLHVPPGVAFVSVVGVPIQVASVPPIAAGKGLTVTFLVAKHPVGSV